MQNGRPQKGKCILKVCSCRKAYFNDLSNNNNNTQYLYNNTQYLYNNTQYLYFNNFSLPLVAEQPMQITCQYHNHIN